MQIVRITNVIVGYDEDGEIRIFPVTEEDSKMILGDFAYHRVHFRSISKSPHFPGFYELVWEETAGKRRYIAELKGDIVDLLFGDDTK